MNDLDNLFHDLRHGTSMFSNGVLGYGGFVSRQVVPLVQHQFHTYLRPRSFSSRACLWHRILLGCRPTVVNILVWCAIHGILRKSGDVTCSTHLRTSTCQNGLHRLCKTQQSSSCKAPVPRTRDAKLKFVHTSVEIRNVSSLRSRTSSKEAAHCDHDDL